MRYALIAIAIGASLLCLFVAWRLWLGEQVVMDPDYVREPDYTNVVVLIVAAIVLAFAAGGLIARRAEGAYLLSVAAFMLVMPLGVLVMLSFIALGVNERSLTNLVVISGVWAAFGLDLWVAVKGMRLGRRMRAEVAPPDTP